MAQLPALHKACLDGSLEGVRAALAQPDAPQVLQTPDADGRTPLHWAASSDAKHALIEALHAGHTTTLGKVLCSGGDIWTFSAAPPRRAVAPKHPTA